MVKIGIVSDTHGHWDAQIEDFFGPCASILHAGDIGSLALADRIAAFRPLYAVSGNIDDALTRSEHPLARQVQIEGVSIYMQHIGGHPGRYAPGVRQTLQRLRPRVFIAGHSHILRVVNDRSNALLYINPGAYGHHGFHAVRTAVRLDIDGEELRNLEVLNLPRAGR